MADTMQFDLVSPERRVASFAASEVLIPGTDGNLTAMPQHSPVITTLRPGVLRVVGEQETREFVVTGGFAEVTADSVSVLAERALPASEVTREHLDQWIEEANTTLAQAREHDLGAESVDSAAKLLADMVAMGTEIGLSDTARAPAP
ncbi:ATP synthase F1 subunit epsilon [Brevirhabdus pacifica]|uniref:ATP synthase epsilon chain n=1 Tax=Brevirhabdus pacifica TaxID=1267768 RepID=A0A1U7DH72_9RHOB|nr:F0F1 ATP synthase subunit epsilon [Brevirhabdus pacifica]APX89249.1 ATP synthase F1 subunit epsilon [Brevirhabdus pacifica]OWU76706.1 ATP synthase F0F1 subunit epsilon [Loktanella sp. 22II-4b]PJJ86144.1 ATP synthase F1 subcomplex epsilon subunit [Brevirhabdus pacifica]